jgi:uncharacterized protein YkwD
MLAELTVCTTLLLLGTGQATDTNATDSSKAIAETAVKIDLLPIEQNIFQYTNAERARHGLPALEIDEALMKSARQHCEWMTLSRSLVHTRQPVAENIAMGQPHSSEAVRSWMGSSGHRANILNGGHRRIGVAAYRTPEGTIFWCQQFRP